jgi:hypothetical protein
MALFSRDIIGVLFARGAASLAPATLQLSATFLALLAFMAPLNAVNTLAARLFMADRQIIFSFYYQIAFSAVLSVSLWVLVKGMGALGYPAALLCMYALNLVALVWILAWRFPFLSYLNSLRSAGKMLLANLALSALAWRALAGLSSLPSLARMAVITVSYAGALLLLNQLVGLNQETTHYLRSVRGGVSGWLGRGAEVKT